MYTRFDPARARFWRLLLNRSALFLLIPFVSAQHRLMIPNPYDVEQRLEVSALEGALCLVDPGFGPELFASNQYYFEEAQSYAEGFVEINRPNGFVLEDEDKQTFEFSVKVKPSRTFGDCFVVLRLYTQDGREFLVPYEIGDLRPDRSQTVSIKPELSVELGRGVFYYHFFSQGQEIYFAPTEMNLGKKRPRPVPVQFDGSRDPELEQLPASELPGELTAMVSSSEALVAVAVNDNGFSVDHTILTAPSRLVGRVAVDLIKNARFTPAAEEGKYVRRSMLLRVVFDARGQYHLFAEN